MRAATRSGRVTTPTAVQPATWFAKAALTEPLACVLHGMDALDLPRYAWAKPAEVIVFGGGPIGLLFVAALAADGHRAILADPNPERLEAGLAMGAAETVRVERGGGQAEAVKAATHDGQGAWIAIDATGVPEVWLDAIRCVRPGGLVASFSCSGPLQEAGFVGMLFQSARRAERGVRLLTQLGAAPDHPQRPGFARSRYLKGALLAVD